MKYAGMMTKQKRWDLKNPEKIAEYKRNWIKNNPEKRAESLKKHYENGGKEKSNAYYHAHKDKWRDKYNARARVRNAIESGILVRPEECSQCKRICKPETHHADYSQPLQVVWLCRSCHVLVG